MTKNQKVCAVAEDVIAQVLCGAMVPASSIYFLPQPDDSGCMVCAIGAAVLSEHVSILNKDKTALSNDAVNGLRMDGTEIFTSDELRGMEDVFEITQMFGGKLRRILGCNLPGGDNGADIRNVIHNGQKFKPKKEDAAVLLTLYALIIHNNGNIDNALDDIRTGNPSFQNVMPIIRSVAEKYGQAIPEDSFVCDSLHFLKEKLSRC